MTPVCAEQHKFHHPSHHFLPSKQSLLKDITIPPRQLFLTHAGQYHHHLDPDMSNFSFSDEALRQKFLPLAAVDTVVDSDNGELDEDDPYSSDHFRMYEFKVRRCTRSRSHDWTHCPFAHPGEKARRRDPRRFHYSGTVCPEFRRGACSRGDSCEFAHGVFECWLHPARYRTEACKDGKNCKRKVCFFAHSPRQLRILPVNGANQSYANSDEIIQTKNERLQVSKNCCLFCHCGKSSNNSPTSTLLGMSHLSPSVSPPLSPVQGHSFNGFSPISRTTYADHSKLSGGLSCKYLITERMSSLDLDSIISFNEANKKGASMHWVDVSSPNGEDQLQFLLSPSTPSTNFSEIGNCFSVGKSKEDENKLINEINNCSCSDPDLGWVNELLM